MSAHASKDEASSTTGTGAGDAGTAEAGTAEAETSAAEGGQVSGAGAADGGPAEARRAAEPAGQARRSPSVRRAAAGEVLPTKAAEDDPRRWGDQPGSYDHDAWLREQRPPHWG
ncbi:hypothetical protein ACTWLI_10180 [Arthrobacter sp. Hor0625]|uniref:hypothetical protein n=1 Tax=Arthrobacter sp. Hor0625 TaxID=3457358 RepID=UPI00403E72B8